MIQRTFLAATAAFLILCVATPTLAHADMVLLRDGTWLPQRLSKKMGDAKAPNDFMLGQSGKNNLKLEYDKVSVGRESVSAGAVADVFSTAAFENEYYRNGDLQGQAGAWLEAADSFARAAEELKGSAREIALWKRVACLANAGNADATMKATDELLTAFPKAFYTAAARDKRARIFLSQGASAKAKEELNQVIAAAGMNPFHLFEAKLAKIHFFSLVPAGDDVKKIALARSMYEQVAQEIKGRTDARDEAAVQLLKAQVGIGRCLVYEGDFDKALRTLKAVVGDKKSIQDKELLARAYAGMGDAVYAQVKQELAGGELSKDQLPRILETLTDAALHYLRVSKFYAEYAGDDRFPATAGLARVWATQFELGEQQDCDLGKRAAKTYYEAHNMLPRGERQRIFRREAKGFIDKFNAACEAPTRDATKGGKKNK